MNANGNAISKWFKYRQEELFERQAAIMEGRAEELVDMDGDVDRQQLADDLRMEALASEDWRGHYMPDDLT